MKRFLVNAIKYYTLIALIPALGLYFSTEITLMQSIRVYLLIFVVLLVLSGLIQGVFFLFRKDK